MNLDRTKWNINIGCLYEFSRLDSAEIVDAYTVPGWYADKVKKGDGFNPISIRKKTLLCMIVWSIFLMKVFLHINYLEYGLVVKPIVYISILEQSRRLTNHPQKQTK